MSRPLIALVVLLALAAAACGGDGASVGLAAQEGLGRLEAPDQQADGTTAPVVVGPEPQEQVVGEVTVIATFDPGTPTLVELAFDTHTVDLDFDVPASTSLSLDGAEVSGEWEGSEPGGHHRAGTFSLPAAPGPGQTLTLTFTGLERPAVFEWRIPP